MIQRSIISICFISVIFLNACNYAEEKNKIAEIREQSVKTTAPDSERVVTSAFSGSKEKEETEDTTSAAVEEQQETSENTKTEKKIIPTLANKTLIEKKGNVIEYYQTFSHKDENGAYLSESLELDLSNTSNGMLSAYSVYKSDYRLYFRVFEKDSWSEWKELPENTDVNNPKRKVFAPKQLDPTVLSIQFKSDQAIPKEVIFRIFTFSKD